MSLSSKFVVFSFFLFLVFSFSVSLVGAVDGSEVTIALADAEEALVSAYDAVLGAEEAGADVSDLLERLNVGGEYLAEAYVWYRLGVNENASYYANLCREAVEDASGEAFLLKDEADSLTEADFVVRMVESIIGVIIVVVLGFVFWRAFRRRYHKRVLRLKPEVVSDES